MINTTLWLHVYVLTTDLKVLCKENQHHFPFTVDGKMRAEKGKSHVGQWHILKRNLWYFSQATKA